MYACSSAKMNPRCPSCGTVAREGAAYCPQCGTSLPKATPTFRKPGSKGRFPFWPIFFGLCIVGVYSNHHHVHVSAPSPLPDSQMQHLNGMEALPADALQAIQPSQDAQWSADGQISLNIYNGSDWVVHSIDLQVKIDRGWHAVTSQTYRATAQSPLMPMESGYFSVQTALPRMRQGSGATYRVVGALGKREND